MMPGIQGCEHDECVLAKHGPETPHDFGQGAIDWEAAERAAIAGEDEPTPEEKAAAASVPDAERPKVEQPAQATAPPQVPKVIPASETKTRLQTMRGVLDRTMPQFRAIIPKGVSLERLFSVAYVAMERNPLLLECTAISILRGITIGAQLGLDVSGVGGLAYLVPFRNKRTGQREAAFVAGYRGLIELTVRAGKVAWIYPGLVHQNDDEFTFEVSPIPRMHHKPNPDATKRGEIVGAYAVAVFTDPRIPPMPWPITRNDVERARARSQNGNSPTSPWTTDYGAMAMKTAIRALSKYLPWAPDLAAAQDAEDRAESLGASFPLPGELPPAPDTEDEPPADPDGPTPTVQAGGASEAISKALAKPKRGRPKKEE